jgi:hypothetical protein
VVAAGPAGVAFSAKHLGHYGNLVPGFKLVDVVAHFYYLSGNLMPLDHGIGGIRMLTMIHVNIRPANADIAGANQDFSGTYLGQRDLPELDLPR